MSSTTNRSTDRPMSETQIEITTQKLSDLRPTWARVPGWSVLFDNPGMAPGDGSLQALTAVGSSDAVLYDRLAEAAPLLLGGRDALRGLAWLPRSTFHVTVADGLSA